MIFDIYRSVGSLDRILSKIYLLPNLISSCFRENISKCLNSPAGSKFIAADNNPFAIDKLFFATLLLLRDAWSCPAGGENECGSSEYGSAGNFIHGLTS